MIVSMRQVALSGLCLAWLAVPLSAQEGTADENRAQPAAESQSELHAKLSSYLSGTRWTGKFTLDGKDKTITEYYEILSAEKSEFGDQWNLVARIKYNDHDMTLPLPPIEIKFAGRTPVITLDKVAIPGFGTFDARVVIRSGKYAGTWSHDSVGGHMFGTIEKMPEEMLQKRLKEAGLDKRPLP